MRLWSVVVEPRQQSVAFVEIASAAAFERRHEGQRDVGHGDALLPTLRACPSSAI